MGINNENQRQKGMPDFFSKVGEIVDHVILQCFSNPNEALTAESVEDYIRNGSPVNRSAKKLPQLRETRN